MAAAIMQTIDTTIANVALPRMQGSLAATQDEISWVLTSYIVAAAITIPLTGWLAGRFGRRPVFLISIAGFTVASALCGIATSINEIVFFRLLQGISGAALLPLSQSILFDINTKENRGRAMAGWGMAVTLGPVIGPVVGGWFTDNYNWRWVFFINVPIGIFVLIGLLAVMPDTKKIFNRFDFFGFFSLAISLGALQVMLDRGERQDWFNSNEIIIETIIMGMAFYLFLVHTLTHPRPFVSPKLFEDRNFIIANIFIFLVVGVLYATLALQPPMLQNEMGYPVFTTGLVTAPRGLGMFFSMMFVGRIVGKINTKIIITCGLLLSIIALWQMTHFNLQMDARPVIISGIIQGLGIGLIFVPITIIAFTNTAPELLNEATALFNLIRNIGSSIGISVLTAILVSKTQIMHANLSEHITPYSDNIPATEVGIALLNAAITRQAAMVAYINDYKFMMVLIIVSIPLVLLIREPKITAATEKVMVMD